MGRNLIVIILGKSIIILGFKMYYWQIDSGGMRD